jgi:glycosyltransferase involved in cell wall biosynthesis
MNEELTIVIPARNEEENIGNLLSSLCRQDLPNINSVPILVADAHSSDHTVEVALSFRDKLNISVVKGGLPAEGRNAGAQVAQTRYLLFLDADVEVVGRSLIRRALQSMKRGDRHCVTTWILAKEKMPLDYLMYAVNATIQALSKYSRPFSPGAFMLFDRQRFIELGGFNEAVLYAEDYFLTRQLESRRFAVVPGFVRTSSRRFKKMGRLNFIWLFLKTVMNSGNEAFFFQNHGYWD